MNERYISVGVPFAALTELLGDPMDSAALDGASTGEVTSSIRRWDCLEYEKTYRKILQATSEAPESDHGFVTHVLSVASKLHLLMQCRAELLEDDRWVLRNICVVHLWRLRSHFQGVG